MPELHDIFVESTPAGLLPKQDVKYQIKVKAERLLPRRPVTCPSIDEPIELKQQLNISLQKKLIRPSSSPYGDYVPFVKNRNRNLRMVCHLRAIYDIFVSDANPILLIDEVLDQVSGAVICARDRSYWSVTSNEYS